MTVQIDNHSWSLPTDKEKKESKTNEQEEYMPFVPKGQKTNQTYKKIFLPQEINFDSNNEAIFKQQL